MKKPFYSAVLLAFLAAALLFMPSCDSGTEPADDTATSSHTDSSTTAPVKDNIPVCTGEIFSAEDAVFFVDPATGLLTRYTAASGTSAVLYGRPVWKEFLLAGEKLYFRDLESGRICSAATDGSGLEELFELPMTTGTLIGEDMYFIDERAYGRETAVYSYNPERGEWSVRVLENVRTTPVRNTLLFSGAYLIYISEKTNYDEIIRISLSDWTVDTIYSTENSEFERVYEIIIYNGNVLFAGADAAGNKGVRSVNIKNPERTEFYPAEADRLLSAAAEGFLFTLSEDGGDTVYFANRYGGSAGYCSGVIADTAGSDVFVMSSDYKGQAVFSILRPPETEELLFMQGRIETLRQGDGYALVRLEGSSRLYLVRLETCAVSVIESTAAETETVPVAEYLKNPGKGKMPDISELDGAAAYRAAEVFAAAVCSNDRKTLSLFMPEGTVLRDYYPFYAKSCRITRFEIFDGGVAYTFEYSGYTEKDETYEAYLPAELTGGGVVKLMKTEGKWTATPLN